MFTILHFTSIFEFITFYVILFIIIAIPAYFFYKKAVASRKKYRCTNCGEIYTTELMESSNCKVCGAPVEEIL